MKPETTDVTGTLTQKNLLTPFFYDAVGDSIRVGDTSIETAIKALKPETDALMLGFSSQQALKATLRTDDGEEITFSRKGGAEKTYMFANEVFGSSDFARLADPENPLSEAFNRIPKAKLADPQNVVYTSIMGVSVLQASDQQRVTLIDKKGKQLFPKK